MNILPILLALSLDPTTSTAKEHAFEAPAAATEIPAVSVPAVDDERAFYLCIKSVVRRLENENSISTFAGRETATTLVLDSDRYVIRSEVEDSAEEGVSQRHLFSCTLRHEAGRWIVEEVELEPVGQARIDLAVTER